MGEPWNYRRIRWSAASVYSARPIALAGRTFNVTAKEVFRAYQAARAVRKCVTWRLRWPALRKTAFACRFISPRAMA